VRSVLATFLASAAAGRTPQLEVLVQAIEITNRKG